MPQIVIALVIMIVSYALQSMFAPVPQDPVAGQLDVPVAQEGDSISVIFGEVLIKDSNVLGYWDAQTSEVSAGGGGGKK